MSCGCLMPKYVISAYLTYMYFIQKLAWGGCDFVEKTVLSCYGVQSNKYFGLFPSQLVYRNKVVKVVNANRFPEKLIVSQTNL